MERYICIHGHFYQPPRENPWLEAIELQDSAFPYHDWNERITAECYAPNAASRIMDGGNRIEQIVSNYAHISFNFGPTLLAWMEGHAPQVHRAIVAADAESRQNFSGHGSAIAQVYNHMILPLANSRDKRTQVLWGIRDFEWRFGRKPEGMWLSETAVDLDTLEILVEAGIRFTVLSPYQASRVRATPADSWQDVTGGAIDPSMPYLLRLRSGRNISLFFYDGPISQAVAFENLLDRGENLANRLLGAFSDHRDWPQLVNMATDGETYGHHRRHADMALAYALHHIQSGGEARLTNYGEHLDRYPAVQEVEIIENSSWSCIHGVERWRADCGCHSGGNPGWNQRWRGPLRDALDWLRDCLAVEFENRAASLFPDPWRARDAYIGVILDRSPVNATNFLAEHARPDLAVEDRIAAWKLLELQRHAMLMYTSCGWFFDELSGIETVQVIEYAARALQLAEEITDTGLEEGFLQRLELAKSNLPEHGDGRRIYEKYVRPAVVTLEKVAAHYAISSLFEPFDEKTQIQIYCYTVRQDDFRLLHEGKAKLALGRASICSCITGESEEVSFGVLHLGDQNIYGGVRRYAGDELYQAMVREAADAFRSGFLPELIRTVDRKFGEGTFSLRNLFRDEQRKVVGSILDTATAEAAALYRNFYGQYGSMIRFVTDLGIPLPGRFQMAIDLSINEDLLAALGREEPNAQEIKDLIEQIRRSGIHTDNVALEFAFRKNVERMAKAFCDAPLELSRLRRFERVTEIGASLPFEVNLWVAQNIYYEAMAKYSEQRRASAANGDAEAGEWVEIADSLGDLLYVNSHHAAGKTAS